MSEKAFPAKENPEAEQPAESELAPKESLIDLPSSESIKSQIQPSEDSFSKSNYSPLIEIAVKELESRRNEINEEIKELSKRKANLEKEITSNFTGQSDAIARRVKGFQDYLTGALQNLAQSAETLDLVVQPVVLQPSPLDQKESIPEKIPRNKLLL